MLAVPESTADSSSATGINQRSRGALRPRLAKTFSLEKREQGMPGARRTRGLVCNWKQKAHTSIQVQPKHAGIPCAMALRLMPRSLRRRIRLASVTAGLLTDRSGRTELVTDSLAPATGVETTRFCRTRQRRSSCASFDHSRSTALRSRSRPTLPRPPHPIPRP